MTFTCLSIVKKPDGNYIVETRKKRSAAKKTSKNPIVKNPDVDCNRYHSKNQLCQFFSF